MATPDVTQADFDAFRQEVSTGTYKGHPVADVAMHRDATAGLECVRVTVTFTDGTPPELRAFPWNVNTTPVGS